MNHQHRNQKRTPLEDQAIVDLYWQRDEKAIEETDLKYRRHLLAVAHNIVHDPLDSEECLDDTYIGAWNAMPPSKPKALRAFLTTIMRRISVNRYHSNQKKSSVPSEMTVSLSEIEDFATDATSTEEAFETQRLAKIISDFLRCLSERSRFIFMSRYYMANTVNKIAEDLHMSRSTVNKELAAIRNDLKEILEKEGFSV